MAASSKTTWATGDQLTAAELNRIEQGVSDGSTALPVLGSRMVASGHSYLSGGGNTHVDRQFIALLSGMLRCDLRDLGVGASQAGYDGAWGGSTSGWGGWAWIRQMHQTYRTSSPYSPGTNALPLIVTGLNDLVQHHSEGNARAVWKHALRSILSWFAASRTFEDNDATIAYSGGGTWSAAIAQTNRNSGAGYRPVLSNGATFTITLPADFEGGAVGIDLIAFPAGDGQIAWTGTASQLPGTTQLGGVAYATGGAGGQRSSSNGVVARATGLTAADAGKTIIGTYSGGANARVADPTAPGAITQGGTAGAATYSYARVYRYFNGETVLSPTTTTNTGAATLTGTNFNTIPAGPAWPAGVEAELVIRTAGGTAQGLVATLTTGPAAVNDTAASAAYGTYTPAPSNPLTGGFAVDAWHIESNTPVTRGVVCNIAKLPAATNTAVGITNADVDNYNADIASVVSEFTGNQWLIVDTDTALGANAAYFAGTGNVHPNDRGHAIIAQTIYKAITDWSRGITLADQAHQSRVMKRIAARNLVEQRYGSPTGVNYTLTNSWADIDATYLSGGIDAVPGDDLEFVLSGMWMTNTNAAQLDIALFDGSGTLLRYLSAPPTNPTAGSPLGWPAWYNPGISLFPISGSAVTTVQKADLTVINTVQGIVFWKLRGASSAGKGIYGGGFNSPLLQIHVKNLGQRNTPGLNAS